ncbi:MAG: nucleoside hydrolase [Candidatus Lokiarchaeia archaeon]
MKKIIYDGDPGIDDAMAIILAIKSDELDLEAVTTVAGNVPLEKATKNALRILRLVGRLDIPVAAGMPSPLVRELQTSGVVHGEDGLGRTNLPLPSIEDKCIGALNMIIAKIMDRPGEFNLVACGPLTNLAEIYNKQPKIGENVGQVVIMGGAIHVPGNVTPYAEYNIHTDPESAQIILQSDLPITLVPLDVTMRTILTPDDLEEFYEARTLVAEFVYNAMKYYQSIPTHKKLGGCPLHDPLAIGIAVDESFVKMKKLYVKVVTDNIVTLGKTLVSEKNTGEFEECSSKHNVCLEVDARKFIRFFIDTLTAH